MDICINNMDENLFRIGGREYIKFPEIDGMIPMVLSSYWTDEHFGYNNNFAESYLLDYMKRNMLPEIEDAIGAENLVEFETDLTALDGDDSYGIVKSKISIPTLKFYRDNETIFNKCRGYYWWTATPSDIGGDDVCAVYPSGDIEYERDCGGYDGIRPMIMVKASVFGS